MLVSTTLSSKLIFTFPYIYVFVKPIRMKIFQLNRRSLVAMMFFHPRGAARGAAHFQEG